MAIETNDNCIDFPYWKMIPDKRWINDNMNNQDGSENWNNRLIMIGNKTG